MKKLNKLHALIALTFITLIVISCDFKGITDDVDITINSSVFNKQIVIEMFDPVDQSNLEGNNVLEVEIIGLDADKIVTDAGNNDLKIVDGVVSLGVNPNKNITGEPVQFILKVTGENYLTTTVPVFISDKDSVTSISANIVNKLNTPKGIDYIKNTESLVNNTLSNDVSFETSGSKAGTSSEVTIKAGTIFKDIDGNNITGGEIESEVVHFNSSDPESLGSFPGGFMPQEITDENGDILNDAYFETAGFVSIDMTIGNKEVKNFSEPITIKTKVDSEYINPETGNIIKIGDVIPIWSYSKDDGKWEFHTKGTVAKDADNNLIVEYTTTHLSWYNLDYYGSRCAGGWSYSYSTRSWTYTPMASINIAMNGVDYSNSHYLYTDFVFAGTNQSVSYWSGKTKNFYDGLNFELLNAPNRNLQMLVYSGSSRYQKGELLYRSSAFNPCSGSINLDISNIVSKLPQLVNVNINYKGNCNGKILEPTIPLYMKDQTYGYWRYVGYVYRGKITIRQIELNKEYEFRTYYAGQYFYQNITFDKTEYVNDNYQVPSELCDRLF